MTAPTGPLDQLVGRDIAGRYRVVAKLGQGGMGTVFRAEQISLKRNVALKVLDPNLFQDKELVRRFHTEAELAAKLSHPHTVTLYDFGESEGGLLFIAMELLEGRSLRDVIAREAPITAARVVDIGEQVASSLADAHGHGIVHRDLKPDNVMLQDRAGRKDFARVLDFGIAKLRDERQGGVSVMQHTQAGQLLGTPAYMAPEQIMGNPVDGRTDVYALGVLLYEMICGRPPFEATNVIALLTMHMNERPMAPHAKRQGIQIPQQLAMLVMRCLEKKPDARPATMQVVADELNGMRLLVGAVVGSRGMTAQGQAMPPQMTPMGAQIPTPMRQGMPGPQMTPPHMGPQMTPMPPQATPVPPQQTPMHRQPTPMPVPMGGSPVPPQHTPMPPPQFGQATPYGQPSPFAQPSGGGWPGPGQPGAHPWAPGQPIPIPPKESGGKTWLWLGLGLLGLIGLMILLYKLVVSDKELKQLEDMSEGKIDIEEWKSLDDDKPEGVPGLKDIPVPSTDDVGSRYRPSGSFDFHVDPPSGIQLVEEGPGRASGTGWVSGVLLQVEIEAVELDGSSLTMAMLEEAASAFPAGRGGTVVETRKRTIAGEPRVSLIYDVEDSRFEAVLYPRRSSLVVLHVGASRSDFDRTLPLRDQLFERRIVFGDGTRGVGGGDQGGFGPGN